jgi:hypothetical protein
MSQCDCNLFTYSVERGETKTTLERDGFWNLGEVVNKFIIGKTEIFPIICLGQAS